MVFSAHFTYISDNRQKKSSTHTQREGAVAAISLCTVIF